ncbi:MAG: acyl-CoA thioesterase, partial [Ignavibacteria bacterium]
MITSEFIVNFYDCDPAGIIFYANIFKYAHSNYEKMIESFKLAHDYFVNDSYVVPIIHSEADYLKPIKTGEKIKVQTTVTILKDASFELTHRFFDDQNELKAK